MKTAKGMLKEWKSGIKMWMDRLNLWRVDIHVHGQTAFNGNSFTFIAIVSTYFFIHILSILSFLFINFHFYSSLSWHIFWTSIPILIHDQIIPRPSIHQEEGKYVLLYGMVHFAGHWRKRESLSAKSVLFTFTDSITRVITIDLLIRFFTNTYDLKSWRNWTRNSVNVADNVNLEPLIQVNTILVISAMQLMLMLNLGSTYFQHEYFQAIDIHVFNVFVAHYNLFITFFDRWTVQCSWVSGNQ